MLSFKISGGEPAALLFFEKIKVITLAESLGGVESLIEYPFIMTHAAVPVEMRAKLGIDDKLIRVSVGIEDTIDILHDVNQALKI